MFLFKTSEAGMDFHSKVFDICSEVMNLIQVLLMYILIFEFEYLSKLKLNFFERTADEGNHWLYQYLS